MLSFITACKEGKADIMFVLDESSSVGQKHFGTMKSFVENVATNLPVGSDSVHVGLLKYGFGVYEEFDLNTYQDPSSLKNAIEEVGYEGGMTNTHKALDYLRTNSFTAAKGDREDAPNIAILITDGKSFDKEKTKETAERLKAAGVTVFSIGVENAVQEELEDIASKPSSEYVFYAENFSGLDEIKEHISADICNICDSVAGFDSVMMLPKLAPATVVHVKILEYVSATVQTIFAIVHLDTKAKTVQKKKIHAKATHAKTEEIVHMITTHTIAHVRRDLKVLIVQKVGLQY
ncbi:Hypothetical predicted protein [Octopus vulgaris]|uniref:VWFA domain-containing protein n=1 Tax=Octopus vulgaris TaxID=6645 RepID=A0AA36F172_OCTVU|nr:Hypothetical predicted protein [Octopus vulgaris]